MKYSVITLSFNNKALTEKCLESIKKNTKGREFELIVVDNHSTDGAKELLRDRKDIRLIDNKDNLGFSKGNNQGARKAKGEILVFLNNDTEVQSGWLNAIDDVFKKEKNVGAVGVKLLYPDGTIQHAGVMIAADHAPRHIYAQKTADYEPANRQRDYKEVTAACIAIPKDKFWEVGGFDEAFKNGFEDVDLCLKLYHKGYRIIYTPKAVVLHHESVAPGRFNYDYQNLGLYMERWKNETPDAHKYFREDGHSWIWIYWNDLYLMSWGKDRYGTRPTWVKFARLIFIPVNKLVTFIKLLFTGNFTGISGRLKGSSQ